MGFILKTKDDNPPVNWQQLAEMIARAGLSARDPQILQRAYQHSQFVWFGYVDGKLMATAHAISDLTYTSYLSDVIIDPQYQGNGYGRQLMQAILEALSPFGKVVIYSMLDKIEFYQNLQFHRLNSAMVYAPDSIIKVLRNGKFID
ncbi:GNAT family N-acetyltransferase [Erwiniaceae bacterium BAC15a-03b]|uniref:GNAT family N-acetyltransferase n=1 Tax=Winslowiella arboricola TaxID=2978220 RepID=A0A9J6PIQ1_9GAMM|nr:GNAT family N-acetyltransferase [Winslowiella arboricola]MCU5774031.1 GNAT family N-acetyltransferase [Winslowiella arboricola]MCU5777242.1 GNAT family N-acetyltransferase [Winslowiella arboricola]